MTKIYFVTYPSALPWGSNFFGDNLAIHSENEVIQITPKQSRKIKDAGLFFHNIQTIPKTLLGKLNIGLLKKNGNTVIAGFRGHVGFDKLYSYIPMLDHTVCNIDPRLINRVMNKTKNFTVLYPGADSELFRPLPRVIKTTDISWMGRDHKSFKNSDILPRLGYSYIKATYRDYIPHKEIPHFLNRTKVHLVTSDHEGFNRPALEASLCGIPVVAPRIGVVPYIIDNEWTIDGHPQDAVDQYKELVGMLLSDPKLCKLVGEENRVRALKYSWEHSAEIFDGIIKDQTG